MMWRQTLVWVIVSAAVLSSAVIVAVPVNGNSATPAVEVGQPAPADILAPTPVRYASAILTEQAREAAAQAIADIHSAPDARLARQQVVLLRDILDYIAVVRADALASEPQQQADLTAIRDLGLTTLDAALILSFEAAAWTQVEAEAQTVLEQIMRNQVRIDQVEGLRQALPARISVNLNEAEVAVVGSLVRNLIVPNSFFDEAATNAARQAARAGVPPVYKNVLRGQTIVARGRLVTPEDIETLAALSLLQPQTDWRAPLSAALVVVLVGLILMLYVWRFNPNLIGNLKGVALLAGWFVLFLLAAKIMVPGRTLLPFLVPTAALAMLITVLVDAHLATAICLGFAVLAGSLSAAQLELTVYMALGALVAALVLGPAERVNQFFYAGVTVAAANLITLLAFHLETLDVLGAAQYVGASLINGAVAASLALAGMFVLGVFDITTSLQLIELSRPDQPLLREMLRNAPGTYQHSLQVANLAEQAAERIGANALLTRVGALYHDVGKVMHPQFFVENQLDGANIHDTLDPAYSAQIIINHVRDGTALAQKYRLPTAMRTFIIEHHGTLKTMYQYQRALKAADHDLSKVDATKFTYPGPRPQSRETALLMLADGCEARARAERPKSEDDIARIVNFVVDDRLAKGQLDDTRLTVRDLALIRESYINTLKGVFHPRLQYPDDKATK